MFLLLSLILTYLQRVMPWQQSLEIAPRQTSPNCYNLLPTQFAQAYSASQDWGSGQAWYSSQSDSSWGCCLGAEGGGGFAPTFTQLEGKKPFSWGFLITLPNHQPFSKACQTTILSPFSKLRQAIAYCCSSCLSSLGFYSLSYSLFLSLKRSSPSFANSSSCYLSLPRFKLSFSPSPSSPSPLKSGSSSQSFLFCASSTSLENLQRASATNIILQNPTPKNINPNPTFKTPHLHPFPYNDYDYRAVVLSNAIIIVKMRYQSKTNRSLSYLLRDSVQPRHQHNKQNSNVINFPALKDNLPKGLPLQHIQEELKHDKRGRNNIVVSVGNFLRKATVPEELKRTYTKMVMNDYSSDLSEYFSQAASNHQCDNILLRHEITSSLRSKMVDWMIEVLSSYKMTEETFFKSVYLMDAYLKRSRVTLQVKELHLIGLTAMFLASKYEEIHPLKLEVIYDKIARKKFKKSEILECQAKMIEALMFSLENPSVYDIARLAAERIKSGMSDKSSRYFEKIILYLSKMVLFNSQLAGLAFDALGGGVVYIGLKTLEQADPQISSQQFLPQICTRLSLQEPQLIQTSRRVLQLAKNFSSYFPSLLNLKKFNRFEYQ